MNVIRVKYVRDLIRKHYLGDDDVVVAGLTSGSLPLHGIAALDVGCGGGLLSESLTRLGATVTGLDPSTALIHAAEQHASTHLSPEARARLEYVAGITVEEFGKQKQPDCSFDVVCCLEVIEHVPDPASMLQAAQQLLKPNGLMFVSTINKTAKSFALTILGAEYVLRALPVGTHQWTAYKSPQDVRQLLSATNLREFDVSGMVVSPLSLPSIVMRNEWNWQLDPNDTDVNWIGCYRNASN